MKRTFMIWIAVLLTPVLGWASPQDGPEQGKKESLRAYLNRVAPLEQAATEVVSQEATEEQTVAAAGTATASDFADRVNGTLQNFLPLFQGVLSGIETSDDKKTVTLRLNPIRAATFGELGITASAKEPEPSETLLELLPEDTRPGQKEAIQKTLDDFTDLTYAATYNYVRKLKPEHLADKSPRRWFFGRNPRLYEELFASFAGEVLAQFPPNNAALEPFFEKFEGDIEALDRNQLEDTLTPAEYKTLVDAMIARRRSQAANLMPKARERAELFGKLAANQPQATLSVTYHERDPLVGRNETSANLSIEMPAVPNINELLRSRRREGGSWQRALDDLQAREKEIEAGTKWSLMASYKEADPYKVSYQPTTEGASPVSLDRPRSSELSIKGQYTRNATWQKMTVEGIETSPALHFAFEVIRVSDDPDRQNRRVATLTYDVPMRKGVSFPVSLVYSDRPEFVSETGHQFSARFGISLNSLFQGN